MKKPIYITLAIVLGSILFTVFYSFAAQNEERIILTTYYPAPYGVYREMRVDRLAVGSLYRYYSGPGFDETTNGTLIVSGTIGVGTSAPNTAYGLDVYNKPIKITPNPSDSTGKYLQVGEYSSFGTLPDGATIIGRNVIPTTTTASPVAGMYDPFLNSPYPLGSGWTSLILDDAGSLTLSGGASNLDVNGLLNPADFVRFKIDESGNVGIGTAIPQAHLHIKGYEGEAIRIESSSNDGGGIKWKTNANRHWYIDQYDTVSGSTQPQLRFFTVDNNGTSPQYGMKLQNGTISIGDSVNPGQIRFLSDSTHFWIDNPGDQKLRISEGSTAGQYPIMTFLTPSHTDHRVGIGTANPAALLHLNQTVDANAFRVDDETSGTTPFIIKSDGNVGIGTANPQAKLDIDGTAGTDGIMFPDDTLQTTAGGRKFVGATTYPYYGYTIGGYAAGDNLCNIAYEGSKMCTAADFANGLPTVNNVWYSTLVSTGTGVGAVRDCEGWTSAGATRYGNYWYSMPTVGACNTSKKLACCK